MELLAAINALEYVKNHKLSDREIEINSDSKYVIVGMTEWIAGWQSKGWKTANKKPVLNRDLWERLSSAGEGLSMRWKYVAGHRGHNGNERCDEIATRFADGENVHLYSGLKEKYAVKLS